MNCTRRLAALPLLVLLSACVGVETGTFNAGQPPPQGSFAGLLNAERSSHALGPLANEARLATAAQGHADDMSIRGYFSHVSANGDTLGDRISATGYNFCWAGENIAQGYATPAAVFSAWMNSQGHRDNMLSALPSEFGLGHAPSGNYWVLVLAQPGC